MPNKMKQKGLISVYYLIDNIKRVCGTTIDILEQGGKRK